MATSHIMLEDEKALARRLNVTPRTLQGWRVRGGGPPFVKISSRCVRYPLAALDQWLEERLASSTTSLPENGGLA